MPVRRAGALPDGGPQVQTHERVGGEGVGARRLCPPGDRCVSRHLPGPALPTSRGPPARPVDVGNSDSDSHKQKFNLNSISSLIIFTVIHAQV